MFVKSVLKNHRNIIPNGCQNGSQNRPRSDPIAPQKRPRLQSLLFIDFGPSLTPNPLILEQFLIPKSSNICVFWPNLLRVFCRMTEPKPICLIGLTRITTSVECIQNTCFNDSDTFFPSYFHVNTSEAKRSEAVLGTLWAIVWDFRIHFVTCFNGSETLKN